MSCLFYNKHGLEEFELIQNLDLVSLLEIIGLSTIQRVFLNNWSRIAVLSSELDSPSIFSHVHT